MLDFEEVNGKYIGCFEAVTLRKLLENVATYFVNNDEPVPNVDSILYFYEKGSRDYKDFSYLVPVCTSRIDKLCELLENTEYSEAAIREREQEAISLQEHQASFSSPSYPY